LFVGGDLHRKGGDVLIDAIRELRQTPGMPDVELHLVTTATVEPEPGIVVHHGLTANTPELIEQYHRADIFCLPTLGDCLPMVLAEAAAAGLPLVSTDVGAISEIVVDGVTGVLVPTGDAAALLAALGQLLVDPDLRCRLGAAAYDLACREHDTRANAGRLVEIMRSVARREGVNTEP
jgi:glycosyltransferase involved in cell wall biosynthesis